MNKQAIAKIVLDAVQSYVDSQADYNQIKVVEDTMLFGAYSQIDSLGLVSIIVDVETLIRDQGYDEFTLTSGEIMTKTDNPFQTVSTLIDFIAEQIA